MDERSLNPTAEDDESARTVAQTTGGSPGPDLEDDESSAMTTAWSLDVTQDSPETSLKGELRPKLVPHRSKLVIPQRVLRPADGDPQLPADYELLKMLGEGGMGVVYAARQASIDRTVAVKMLSSDDAEDESRQDTFLSEAVVTGELEHPNIVPIYDLGRNTAGALFYAMKRVEGIPWKAVIRERSQAENLEILMKVADAVAFAHSRGVLHRDLKPENVMLGGYGEVLVVDWGLAMALPEHLHRSGHVEGAVGMGGTPTYMAPEMATGPLEKIGRHSDIYLLGAILYEIVTGKKPHAGRDVRACLAAVAKNLIEPTDKTGELVEIALKAMAMAPEDRYPSVLEFQGAIREYQSHSESIVLATNAETDLAHARQNDVYDDYARALFGFEEAYELWPQNAKARAGIAETRQAYASSALRKGDFDLGLSLLPADDPAQAALRAALAAAKRERDARQQRLKTLRRAIAAGTALFITVLLGGSWWIWLERQEAVAAKQAPKSPRKMPRKKRPRHF